MEKSKPLGKRNSPEKKSSRRKFVAWSGIFKVASFALTMIVELALLLALTVALRNWAPEVHRALHLLSFAAVAYIIIKRNNPYSIKWVIIILALPVYGLFLYLIFGFWDNFGSRNKTLRASMARGASFLRKDPAVYAELGNAHPDKKRIAGYLGRKGQPLYRNTRCEYYPLGELQFDAMLKDMEKAERFIFLEYFIISSGELWDRIQDILIRKVAQGVEVRIMMDDIGSILLFPQKTFKALKAHGIQILRFNDVHGIISRYYFNYRNHQKIAVIDGNVGYTGGLNVADEYINAYPKLGHWKDTAIRLEGDAVWSLTVAFLQMWDGETKGRSDYEAYRPTQIGEASGFFQPFTDGPVVDADYIAKNIYKLFIYNAKKYIYITTPYLIVDSTVLDALRVAAKGGTDVRIMVPKKWDKWFVHLVTLSNYQTLLEAGVRIFEYTPGFVHAKSIVSDDEHAVIGTINMDFRSYYLHYENGVWICDAPTVEGIKKDLMETFDVCEEIKLDAWMQRPWHEKCLQAIMRLFAVMF